MAYSDYGGYAYRNGVRVPERSDAVLTPEGIRATPGQWPGWTIEEARSGGSFHVLLGDGPIFIGLYKQSGLTIHRLGTALDIIPLAQDPVYIERYGDTDYLHYRAYEDIEDQCVFKVDGHTVTAHWRKTDNHYQFVRLEQPDGNIWHGWSGYGVGAGREDAGYGYSTPRCEGWLRGIWPDAVRGDGR